MQRYVCYKNDRSINPNLHEVILITESEGFSCDKIMENLESNIEAFVIEESALPGELKDLYLWSLNDDKSITVNFDKFKEATKGRLRGERSVLLQKLDIEFMKALEKGEDTSFIASEKQRLRDITKLVDPCKTIEELKALTVN